MARRGPVEQGPLPLTKLAVARRVYRWLDDPWARSGERGRRLMVGLAVGWALYVAHGMGWLL